MTVRDSHLAPNGHGAGGFGNMQHATCDMPLLRCRFECETQQWTPFASMASKRQGLGSAITYARRYGLSAMVGICPEDDDAEGATRSTTAAARGPAPVIPRPAPTQARVANPVTGLKKPEPIEHAEERDENDDFIF